MFVWVQPVRSRHRDWGRGKEKQLVHVLEYHRIGVNRKYSTVLGLIKRQELGERVGPGCWKDGMLGRIVVEGETEQGKTRGQLAICAMTRLNGNGDKFSIVLVPSLENETGVAGRIVPGLKHRGRIHHYAVGTASKPMQRLEEHDRVTKVCAVRNILSIGEARPVHFGYRKGSRCGLNRVTIDVEMDDDEHASEDARGNDPAVALRCPPVLKAASGYGGELRVSRDAICWDAGVARL